MSTPLPQSLCLEADLFSQWAELPAETRAFQLRVRAFLEAEVAPIIDDHWERGAFPHALVPRFGALLSTELGLPPASFPWADPLPFRLMKLELGRVDPSMASFVAVHWGLCMGSIAAFGSDEQRAQWLPSLLTMSAIGSWALTEPLAGSDAARGLRTTARREGDDWILDGEKRWSGNATIADVTVIWARVDDGLGGFLVERGTPGFVVEKLGGKIAKRAMENVNIRCEGLRLPAAARLPGVRRFSDVARQLAYGRVAVAWEALGVATGVFEATLRYAQQREQFGRPISSFQLIQDKLVTMLEHLTAMQAMLMAAARHEQRQGGLDETRASLCKLVCARRAREVCALGRGVLGGNGILLQHGVARLFADMEAIYSYEGTEEMNTLIVGRGITGHSAFV